MDRFGMALALAARAQKHADWIGDDHGDRYEVAMLAGQIDEEMQIVAKEILDHLRAALDYCAREVWEATSGMPVGAPIYFPIAREGANASDFKSFMNSRMPGTPAASPRALSEFQSFQAFADPANVWLPELATLGNAAKHENLAVASVPSPLIHTRRNENGVSVISFEPGSGPKRHASWMALVPQPGGTEEHTIYEARYLVFSGINVELSKYLKESIAGVTRIIGRCQSVVT